MYYAHLISEAVSSYLLLQNFLLITLGAVIYFVMEFKSRVQKGIPFIWGYWLKSNVPNLLLMYLTWMAWYFMYGAFSREWAFVWGLIPNLCYDQLQDLIRKYKRKKE